jgi:hypothetical protein
MTADVDDLFARLYASGSAVNRAESAIRTLALWNTGRAAL